MWRSDSSVDLRKSYLISAKTDADKYKFVLNSLLRRETLRPPNLNTEFDFDRLIFLFSVAVFYVRFSDRLLKMSRH